MCARIFAVSAVLAIALIFGATAVQADVLMLKDGTRVEGIIKKVEAGLVYIRVESEDKMFDILKVQSMDFNTPHLAGTTPDMPVEHFLKDLDAQEMVKNVQDIEKAAADIKKMLGQIRTYWQAREPIASEELKGWEAAKREFEKPLKRYQELLNDLYFHVLAKVDQYNLMMKEASDVYVGVKGLKTGSALVIREYERLPLRKYVPAAWYDTIFYEGYYLGYDDGYTKLVAPRTPDR
jgi:hypothetical protein